MLDACGATWNAIFFILARILMLGVFLFSNSHPLGVVQRIMGLETSLYFFYVFTAITWFMF